MELTQQDIVALNAWEGFLRHKPSWIYHQFLNTRAKIVGYFTGNQKGKTEDIAHSYVLRIHGLHPVESKNIRPNNPIRTIRFASETLPTDPEGGESKNTQYPAFKRMLPPYLIKKDITIRKPVMTVKCPQGGPDIYFEWASYGQTENSQAGVQRFSIWADEKMTQSFYQEQLPRLWAANGDLLYSLTPADYGIGWEYDEIFERARLIIRTPLVRERYKERFGIDYPPGQRTNSIEDIVCLMAASDDNPYYEMKVKEINAQEGTSYTVKSYLDEKNRQYSDPDIVDIRRYGIFRQASGQIFKEFDPRIQVIRGDRYFDAATT